MQVQKSLWKDAFREIRKTKQQFFAIFAIVLLGSGFFAGIKLASPDMKLTAVQYYEDTHLSDVNLLCSYGITEDDAADLKEQSFVREVQPSYYCDVFASSEQAEDDSESVVRLYSYQSSDTLNQLYLVSGRLPEAENECVVDSGTIAADNEDALNTTVTFSLEEDDLSDRLVNTTYKVVGVVKSPLYVNYQRGSTTLGSGSISYFYYIPSENFQSDYYTNCYVTLASTTGLEAYTDEYDAAVSEGVQRLEAWAEQRAALRYPELKQAAQEQVDEASSQYEQGRAESDAQLGAAWSELEAARLELETGQAELESGQAALDEGIAQGEQQLSAAKTQLEQAQIELSVQKAVAQANVASTTTSAAMVQSQVDELIASLNAQLDEINAMAQESIDRLAERGLPTDEVQQTFEAQRQSVQEMIASLQTKVDTAVGEIQSSASDQLVSALEQVNAAQAQITEGWADYYEGIAQLEAQRQSGQEQLDAAKAQLEAGQAQYDEGLAQYQAASAQAQQQLDEAKAQLDSAQAQVDSLEEPTWYVRDRSAYNGYADFEDDAMCVDKISNVFAVFFVLVAMLVCLTTMTRMVEEHRTEIGTYQALGYRKRGSMKKYLLYGSLAALAGSILGVFLCEWIFPKVIFAAYGMMYIFPPVLTPVHWDYVVLSAVFCVGCTCLTTVFACAGLLTASPASLMRPKAPKAGKRIFLERIGPIWNRLSFSWKVTMRNFFRYKKRALMTIVGIAGCTALLLAGFGICYSITSILDLQFGELFVYDAAAVSSTLSDEDAQALEEEILSISGVDSAMRFASASVDVQGEDTLVSATVLVPQRPGALGQYYVLRDKDTKKSISLPSSGAVISEKLAELMNVEVGQCIQVDRGDGSLTEVKIAALTENYAGNYIYLASDYYAEVFGEEASFTTYHLTFDDDADEAAVSQSLLDTDEILGVSLVSDLKESFSDTLQSLNYVVLIIIVSAGALAFVVLYNLANINIAERVRELATIKVLGFYDKEVSAYVYRENIVCTLCGALCGLLLGVALTQYILATVEVDVVRFNRDMEPFSFLFAALITAFFALLVNFIMHYKLKKIDMVESLKSVE